LQIVKAGPFIVIDIKESSVREEISASSPQTRDITLDIRIFIRMFPERKPYFAAPADLDRLFSRSAIPIKTFRNKCDLSKLAVESYCLLKIFLAKCI
jgi:hypothetical protein